MQLSLKSDMGRATVKVKFTQLFSKSRQVNLLSAARLFLFGARDIWFVVGLPVYLTASLQWSQAEVGGFLALWVILYGLVQASAPRLVRHKLHLVPSGHTARNWVFYLLLITALMALLVDNAYGVWILLGGLAIFGIIFAINSSVHSYLILAYTEREQVALNVGFYYMANAAGRLLGTLLSGISYQAWGMQGCLWVAAGFLLVSLLFSSKLDNR